MDGVRRSLWFRTFKPQAFLSVPNVERGPEGREEAHSVFGLFDTSKNTDPSVGPFINPAYLHFVPSQ